MFGNYSLNQPNALLNLIRIIYVSDLTLIQFSDFIRKLVRTTTVPSTEF